MALRHQFPLQPIEDLNLSDQNFKKDNIEIPSFKYDPQTLGYVKEHRHGTTIPGKLKLAEEDCGVSVNGLELDT